jgi:hypothetical protein
MSPPHGACRSGYRAIARPLLSRDPHGRGYDLRIFLLTNSVEPAVLVMGRINACFPVSARSTHVNAKYRFRQVQNFPDGPFPRTPFTEKAASIHLDKLRTCGRYFRRIVDRQFATRNGV